MKVLEAECVKLRAAHLGVKICVLADEKVNDKNVIFIPMPDIQKDNKLSLLRFALKLRRTKYDEVIILHDESRLEYGYGESKIFVFIARATRRSLGNIKSLRMWEEVVDKWRRIVIPRTLLKTIPIYSNKLAMVMTGMRHFKH